MHELVMVCHDRELVQRIGEVPIIPSSMMIWRQLIAPLRIHQPSKRDENMAIPVPERSSEFLNSKVQITSPDVFSRECHDFIQRA
jgi:hypothetical protein